MTHPLNVRIATAIKRIGVASNGEVDVRLFPGGQLGSDADMLGQLRAGLIQFQTLSGIVLSMLVPVAAINGVGFAFRSGEVAFAAMDGAVGNLVRNHISAAGLFAFPMAFDNGFRQTTNSRRPLHTPADLRGMKIRVPLGAMWTTEFRAFGAAPASINFNEVYSALQTKVVDGQENPLATFAAAKLFEVQRYCSLTNHMWDGFWLLANGPAWSRLPSPHRELIEAEFSRAASEQRIDIAQLDKDLRVSLPDMGVLFNETETPAFRSSLRSAGFYSFWKQAFGDHAWRILEQSIGEQLS